MKKFLLRSARKTVRKDKFNINYFNDDFFEHKITNSNFNNFNYIYKIKFNCNKLNLLNKFKKIRYNKSFY